jgi:membrane-associated protease RseP (regulator of RpoE activity)
MKTILQLIGCLSMLLVLVVLSPLQASGKLPEEAQKNRRDKTSGYLGVMIEDVSEKIARREKIETEEGAYVAEVMKHSPADSAGLQEGDIIVEYKGKKIFDADELSKLVKRTEPGSTVDLVLVRHGQKRTHHVLISRNKVQKHQMFGEIPPMPDVHVFVGSHILGLHLLTLNDQLGGYFGAPNNEGVLVEEVEQKSAAEKSGFKAGDIILRIGTKTVDAVEKVQKELRKYDEGDKVEFEVLRKGVKKTLSIEMEENRAAFKNFFLRKPHIRIYRSDPFDDASMRMEKEELRSHINDAHIDMKKLLEESEEMLQGFSGPVHQFTIPHREIDIL